MGRDHGATPSGQLRHTRDLLTAQGRHGAAGARLVCYGGNRFTEDLLQAAYENDTVVLATINDLYRPPGDNTL